MNTSSLSSQTITAAHPTSLASSISLLIHRRLARYLLVLVAVVCLQGQPNQMVLAASEDIRSSKSLTSSPLSMSNDDSAGILLVGGIAFAIVMLSSAGALALTRRDTSRRDTSHH